MRLCKWGFVIVLSCFMGLAATPVIAGQEAGKNENAALPAQRDQQILDLIRATQQLAEQSQAELKRSREQNESLQRLLEQTRQELAQLREEMAQLRSSLRTSQPQTMSAATVEKGPQGSIQAPARSSQQASSGTDQESRVRRIEDQVDLNTAQIKEQAQTKIESDSRFKVRLFGTLLSNTYFNTSDRPEDAVPTGAPLNSSTGQNFGHNLGSTFRQTELGFTMTGPKVGEARLSASVDFDFWGGTSTAYQSNVLGGLRMRTASARLDGPRTSLAIGLMSPMISPLNPTSLAAVYYAALGDSGNLWQWRPQVIVERREPIRERDDLVLQGGLLMPFGETVNGTALAGRPGYESRIAFVRRSDPDRRLEIGVGGYYYPRRFGFRRTVDSYAATSDWLIPLTGRFALSGEAFYGQSISLGDQSGADIADEFALTGPLDNPGTAVRGVHSFGGWTQLNAKATPELDFNVAYGLYDPRNRDVFSGLFGKATRLENRTFSVNSIYRLRSNFLVSLEYRRLWTTYPDAQSTNNHINLAIGYLF